MGGGKYIKFGCGARRERSTCSNRRMIGRSIIDNCVLTAVQEQLLRDDFIRPAMKAYSNSLSKQLKALEKKRPNIEKRLLEIQRAKHGLLVLLEKGVDPSQISDRLLELDDEMRSCKDAVQNSPQPMKLDPEEAISAYREATATILSNSLENNYAYKQEVRTAVRELIDKVIIYPSDDPQGRDVEFFGDIDNLFVSTHYGMETVVPRGGIEPPTRGFSIHCATR